MEDERRKKTEELLAGFDRPARTPRAGSVQKNFVDYHGRRGPHEEAAPTTRPKSEPPPRALEQTFVIRRSTRVPGWVWWALLLLAMPTAGALLAWLSLVRGAPAPGANPSAPATASAATTITAASTSPSPSPLPAPKQSESGPAQAPSSAPPRTPPSASARGDFMRNL